MQKAILLFGAPGASEAVADLTKAHREKDGKLSESMREKIGTVGSKHREDMPADAFLLGEERKYPVKVKEDGGWKYSPNLLLAAARRARMEGRDDLAAEADKIRARLEGGGETMKKAILLFGAPGASEALAELAKAQVQGYTRKDGTYVQQHQDSRQEARSKTPHLGAHADALRRSTKPGDMDHATNQRAADLMESGEHDELKEHLQHSDTMARDHVLDHIHPDHWEKLGFKPLNKKKAVEKYEKKFGSAKDKESLDALAKHHGSEAERHYNIAAEKGSGHPDHSHHVALATLHGRAQYHLEQARDAESEDERSENMAAHSHVKAQIEKAEKKSAKPSPKLLGPVAEHRAMTKKHYKAAEEARAKGDYAEAQRQETAGFHHQRAAAAHNKKLRNVDPEELSKIANDASAKLEADKKK